MDKDRDKIASENKIYEISNEITDHCLSQAFTQTPAESFASKIKTSIGFKHLYLKNMVKVYYLFGRIRSLAYTCTNTNNEQTFKTKSSELNNEMLLLKTIIVTDENLYYLFSLCFNFYNNIFNKETETVPSPLNQSDLIRSLSSNKKELESINWFDCLTIYEIIHNEFNSNTEQMQKIMEWTEFPLYCAILAAGHWCRVLVLSIRDHLHRTIFNFLTGTVTDLSSYGGLSNLAIAQEAYYTLLGDLTLHKKDEELESLLGYDENGIILMDDTTKLDYTLLELITNYNQIHTIIVGTIADKLKKCIINEIQNYNNNNNNTDRMDVSKKIPSKTKGDLCKQCKLASPIYYEKGNEENKFCTKYCQLKSYRI
jgi:hypothetical protein